jgi:hypothetical protein
MIVCLRGHLPLPSLVQEAGMKALSGLVDLGRFAELWSEFEPTHMMRVDKLQEFFARLEGNGAGCAGGVMDVLFVVTSFT